MPVKQHTEDEVITSWPREFDMQIMTCYTVLARQQCDPLMEECSTSSGANHWDCEVQVLVMQTLLIKLHGCSVYTVTCMVECSKFELPSLSIAINSHFHIINFIHTQCAELENSYHAWCAQLRAACYCKNEEEKKKKSQDDGRIGRWKPYKIKKFSLTWIPLELRHQHLSLRACWG